jgi:hypothetical protein
MRAHAESRQSAWRLDGQSARRLCSGALMGDEAGVLGMRRGGSERTLERSVRIADEDQILVRRKRVLRSRGATSAGHAGSVEA